MSDDAPNLPAAPRWSLELAQRAIESSGDSECQLLWRLADARGRRVPLSELARDLGLPPSPALAQDLPGLTAFCEELAHAAAAANPPGAAPALPVLTGGADDGSWYWMAPGDARYFRDALRERLGIAA